MTTEVENDDPGCKLYILTPARIDLQSFPDLLRDAIAIAPQIVGAVQLRLKDLDDEIFVKAAETLMPICHDFDIPLIINDRPDIAANVGADGVHVGQQDADYAEARATVGADGIVGVTCHDSRHLAMIAGEQGADYVAFGAFFPSDSKETKYHPEVEILEWCSSMTVLPCVAIGGITADNCKPLVTAGADYLAVIGAVWNHPDGPAAGVSAFKELLNASPS